jgi:hypothetical protein
MAINPGFFPKFPIKPVRDFIGLTQVVDSPTALVIHPSLTVKSIKEFIKYAKANSSNLDFGTEAPAAMVGSKWKYSCVRPALNSCMFLTRGAPERMIPLVRMPS